MRLQAVISSAMIFSLLGSPAAAGGFCRTDAYAKAWDAGLRAVWPCVASNAKRLEPSGKSPDEIAALTATACQDAMLLAAWRAMQLCGYVSDPETDAGVADGYAMIAALNERSSALQVVNTLRARRRMKTTPGATGPVTPPSP